MIAIRIFRKSTWIPTHWPMFKLLGTTRPMEDEFLVGILLIFSGLGLAPAHVGQGKEVIKWHHRHWHPFKPRCRRCERTPRKPSLRRCFGGFKYRSSPTPKCSNSPWEDPLRIGKPLLHSSIVEKKYPELVWLSRVIWWPLNSLKGMFPSPKTRVIIRQKIKAVGFLCFHGWWTMVFLTDGGSSTPPGWNPFSWTSVTSANRASFEREQKKSQCFGVYGHLSNEKKHVFFQGI